MAFTEAEREAIRLLCSEAARTGTDEGIKAAAVMVRKAHEAGFAGSLLELADLIESSVNSASTIENI
jgi:predicted DNA-binding transcriptional regulator YafY